MSTGWTECRSIRNNASTWILEAVEELREEFPFPVTGFDYDNGSEFVNHDVAGRLQKEDIAFTRSPPYRKNDQATVESKNNHVVRKHPIPCRSSRSTTRSRKRSMLAPSPAASGPTISSTCSCCGPTTRLGWICCR